ncbi:tyrosine-type recombinase/integrase [Vibrio lamellibrachiae]|uniref:tyrosine-type recombinase/integrase n=1 Tax=Vibrio lamellibrachiae TaxID=2910253 RepID=UPI003D0DEFF9
MRKQIPQVTDISLLNQWRSTFRSQISLDQFDSLTAGQYSKNSLLAMVKDWNHFSDFCALKNVKSIPASVTAVRLFIEQEAKKRKFSTLKRYTVTISLVHRLLTNHDPVSNSKIRQLLAKYSLDKNGDAAQANSLTFKHLKALDEHLTRSPCAKNIRDLAIYYLMFECALKRSELKNLTIAQVDCIEADFCITVKGCTYRLSERGTSALRLWLSLAGDSNECYVFRAIDRHENIGDSAMDDSSIYRVLKNVSELLQLPIKFSGQSTRVGAAQHLANSGKKAKEIQEFGRWLSPAMPYQYIGYKQKAEDEKQTFKTIRPWE